ncbi:MAG: SDR family NAD(P)-dependent oxidoreductase [Candidatus Peribacteraceae bacterium]|nr:SDR family NAD(P)-dependent oxidoreductase [Candidatus Peribacteraceae bacterium]MDD5074796.1 SDR family NAD(P)-dependent oxidoreductase [Candidatus Peribacteraceae bacterium]
MAAKVALVTAGSRGLGAEIVRTLAHAGHDVAFTYVEHRTDAEALVKELKAMGRMAMAVQADAADFARAHAIVKMVQEHFGGLHMLVCNAGYARKGLLWELSEADWDGVVDVCLKGAFNYIHAAAPILMKQREGKIVCIGSINGLRGRKFTASYNAAKAGLVGLVKAAALEMGETNINVNLVAPGFIETPSQVDTSQSMRDLVLSECAIKRLGKPEDIAPVVAFLCSDAAKHITGQIIKVDAGQYL